MRMEHIALNLPDVRAAAAWYVQHLGMQIISAGEQPPYATFIADKQGRSMLELFQHADPVPPDWSARSKMELHLAFLAEDMDADHQRLLDAGATDDGEPVHTPAGDTLLFMRDPWGLSFQLLDRAKPLLRD